MVLLGYTKYTVHGWGKTWRNTRVVWHSPLQSRTWQSKLKLSAINCTATYVRQQLLCRFTTHAVSYCSPPTPMVITGVIKCCAATFLRELRSRLHNWEMLQKFGRLPDDLEGLAGMAMVRLPNCVEKLLKVNVLNKIHPCILRILHMLWWIESLQAGVRLVRDFLLAVYNIFMKAFDYMKNQAGTGILYCSNVDIL